MPPKKAVKIRGREIEEQEIIYEFEYKNGDTRKRSLTHLDKAQIELVQKYEINQLQGK